MNLLLIPALLLLQACTTLNPANRNPSSIAPLENEARMLVDAIEVNYGPLKMKEESVGLRWEEHKNRFLERMKGAKSSIEVYQSVLELFAGLKDAHVSVSIPSSYQVRFDAQFMRVEGKVLLSHLGAAARQSSQCAAQAGDELVSIEGRGVPELFQLMDPVLHVGNERSTRALQTRALSTWTEKNRLVTLARATPDGKGVARFAFRSRTQQTDLDCTLPAQIKGSPLVAFPLDAHLSDSDALAAARAELTRLASVTKNPARVRAKHDSDLGRLPLSRADREIVEQALKVAELQEQLVGLSLPEARSVEIGQKRPYFKLPKNFRRINGLGAGAPIIGKPFNRASGVFAGIFKRNGKRIGLVRVPSYMPGSSMSLLMADMSLRALLSQMERKTDLLILDQTHNPGGAVILSDWLVGTLVGDLDPEKHLKFAVRPRGDWLSTYSQLTLELKGIEQKELQAALGAGKAPSSNQVFMRKAYLEQMQKQYERVFASYARGEFQSPPVSLYLTSSYLKDTVDSLFVRLDQDRRHRFAGALLDVLYPFHSAQALSDGRVYSKPVFMMIDELDFSGGDATPAILQDYGRVKLVGVNTAGAGGTVEQFSSKGMFPVSYSLTTSLMVRPGGRLVENYGVKPDIEFELTSQDVADGFSSTFDRLLTQLGL